MTTVDITPSPRVLRMLGQIDFAPWQCLAELIDNSIDAFLDQRKAGNLTVNPTVNVWLPNDSALREGTGRITVEDNAGGMTIEQIENSVRAGYSGNDPVEKMGLFGMGFNISTARLGRKTEVWSTTVDSGEWIGLVIDFDELERTRAFHAPIVTKAKTTEELSRPTQGTKIIISRLEAERIRPLIWGAGKRKTKDKLGKIYGRVMTSLGIKLLYDADVVMPWRHCTWSPKRGVETQFFGRVPAIIEIDESLPPRRFCTTCWIWLLEEDESCMSCGSSDDVISRERRLRGWIGVQRFFDKQHFGIDLLRNGRVIQELDKSMFSFTDDAGETLLEYPIDAIHWGGRIVGELEIDFVRVSHQKDSFDKLDPEWKHVVELVRGNSPMQPRIAERRGMPRNTSPLARLFAGYRKGTAGLKDLVPGTGKGVGLNTGVIAEYRERFYDGDPAYQSDEKWFELVEQVERAKRGDSSGAQEAAGDLPIDLTGSADETTDAGTTPATGDDERSEHKDNDAASQPTPPEKDGELSRAYEIPWLPGAPKIRVEAYRHLQDIEGASFRVVPEAYNFRFDYNPRSPFFEESLDTPTDCLLVDLAQYFLTVSSESVRRHPVSKIVRWLKDEYFPELTTSVSEASDSATSLLHELRRHYDEMLPSKAPLEADAVHAQQVMHIRQAALKAESATSAAVDTLIQEGRFARYVSESYVGVLVEKWPDLVLDGKFFSPPYNDVAEAHLRGHLVDDLVDCLQDVVWLREEGGASVSKDMTWRLRFSRALASLRMLQSWRV